MNIEEQVLSCEQMAHLVELGVDTSDASMCWLRYDADGEVRHFVAVNDEMCYEMACTEPCPTYTIGDLIEKLPKTLWYEKRHVGTNIDGYGLLMLLGDNYSIVGYGAEEIDGICTRVEVDMNGISLKDALYKLLCWVQENVKDRLMIIEGVKVKI